MCDYSKAVENQSIVRITSGLCLNKGSNESALAIRIMEVSKNHQNQVCTHSVLLVISH